MELFEKIVDLLCKLTTSELEYVENQAFELRCIRRKEGQNILRKRLEKKS